MCNVFVLYQIASYVIYGFNDYERGVVLCYDDCSITIKNSKYEDSGDVLKVIFVGDKIRFEMEYDGKKFKNKPGCFKDTDYCTFEDIQFHLYNFVYDTVSFYEYCKNWNKLELESNGK